MPIMDGSEACQFILDYYLRYNKKRLLYGDKEIREKLAEK
jgi:hypothetical protein